MSDALKESMMVIAGGCLIFLAIYTTGCVIVNSLM